jgi:hypothetical protein
LINYRDIKVLFKVVVVGKRFQIKVVVEMFSKFRDLSGTFAVALYYRTRLAGSAKKNSMELRTF